MSYAYSENCPKWITVSHSKYNKVSWIVPTRNKLQSPLGIFSFHCNTWKYIGHVKSLYLVGCCSAYPKWGFGRHVVKGCLPCLGRHAVKGCLSCLSKCLEDVVGEGKATNRGFNHWIWRNYVMKLLHESWISTSSSLHESQHPAAFY